MMKLGLFLAGPGQHIAAWRDPASMPDAGMSLQNYVQLAQIAERAKFDFVFNADTQATFGPDDIDIWKRTTVGAAHRADHAARRARGGDAAHRPGRDRDHDLSRAVPCGADVRLARSDQRGPRPAGTW